MFVHLEREKGHSLPLFLLELGGKKGKKRVRGRKGEGERGGEENLWILQGSHWNKKKKKNGDPTSE